MDYQRQTNGWQTFLEHCWFLPFVVFVFATSLALNIFVRLGYTSLAGMYVAGLFVAAIGVALVFYSKLPLYRQRRFFTVGSAALPESRRSFYRWGYRCVFLAVLVLLFLTVLGL